MAQILPPRTNLGTDIGRAFGGSLAQGMQLGAQQQYQRGLLQKALQEAEQVASAPGATALQKSLALTKAFAGIPGGERYAGALIPQIIQYSERQQGNQPGQPGNINQIAQPGKMAEQPNQHQPQPTPLDLVPANQRGNVSDPNAPPTFVAPYDENQIQQIRLRSRELGYTPEAEERFVKDAQDINANARAGYQDILTSYNALQGAREDTLKNQRLFTDYVKENAKEFSSPDELQLALQESEKYQDEPSFARRLGKVKDVLRPYQAAKKGLERTLERPVFGLNKDQLKLAQNQAKTIVDKYGQKDQLRLMIAKGGHGDIEEARLINDLPENFQNKIKGFNKFVNPQQFITEKNPDSPKYQEQLELGNEKLDNQKSRMTDFLAKEIVPGTYRQPGTNLLLIRKDLIDKGLNWNDAGLIIQDAISKGKIELDPHQQIDYQKLGYPPLSAEDYLQNVLNYAIFGKE